MVKLKKTVGTFINTVTRFLEGDALSKTEDELAKVEVFGRVAATMSALLTFIDHYPFISVIQLFFTFLLIAMGAIDLFSAFVDVAERARKKYDGKYVGFKLSEYSDDIKHVICLGIIEFLSIAIGRAFLNVQGVSLLSFYLGAKLVILAIEVLILEVIIDISLKITYSNLLRGWIIKFDNMIRAWVEDDSDTNSHSHGGMSDGIPIPIIVSIVQSYTKNEAIPIIKQVMARFTPGLFLCPLFNSPE